MTEHSAPEAPSPEPASPQRPGRRLVIAVGAAIILITAGTVVAFNLRGNDIDPVAIAGDLPGIAARCDELDLSPVEDLVPQLRFAGDPELDHSIKDEDKLSASEEWVSCAWKNDDLYFLLQVMNFESAEAAEGFLPLAAYPAAPESLEEEFDAYGDAGLATTWSSAEPWEADALFFYTVAVAVDQLVIHITIPIGPAEAFDPPREHMATMFTESVHEFLLG